MPSEHNGTDLPTYYSPNVWINTFPVCDGEIITANTSRIPVHTYTYTNTYTYTAQIGGKLMLHRAS